MVSHENDVAQADNLNDGGSHRFTCDEVLAAFLNGIGSARPRITSLVLFGSRARGDHRTHSDYDILVVVQRKSAALLDALYDSVLDVLLAHSRIISLKVSVLKT